MLIIVPTLQRGNAVGDAQASRQAGVGAALRVICGDLNGGLW